MILQNKEVLKFSQIAIDLLTEKWIRERRTEWRIGIRDVLFSDLFPGKKCSAQGGGYLGTVGNERLRPKLCCY